MKLTAHITIYNFFIKAAIDENPDLVGMPMAVMKDNLIIDVSPFALQSGLKPGITKNHAVRMRPEIKLVQIKDEVVKSRTARLLSACYNLGPRLESVDWNEVFADISGKTPPKASIFKNLVTSLLPDIGSFVTVSLAPNRLLAKAASLMSGLPFDHNVSGLIKRNYKDFSINIIKGEEAQKFAGNLPVEAMWPINRSIIKKLRSLGLSTFSDISRIPLTLLYQQFGNVAPLIMEYSLGKDNSKVPVFQPPGKAIYHAYCDEIDKIQLEPIIKQAITSIHENLRDQGKSYRELTMSLLLEDNNCLAKTSTFAEGKSDLKSLYYDCFNLLNKISSDKKISAFTLTANQLITSSYNQLCLFTDRTAERNFGPTAKNKADAKLARVCANLNAKFSSEIITTGKNLPVSRREQMLMFVDPLRMNTKIKYSQ